MTLARMICEKCKEPELYKYYMTNGVRYVAGASPWKRLVMTGDEMPMSVAMPSDEAMMLLIYENYHGHWVDKHEKKEVVRSPKYTKQEGVQHGKWSDDGIARFNELVKEVKSDQASQNGKKVEEAYQKEKRTDAGLASRKRRKVMPAQQSACSKQSRRGMTNNDDSESENE